MVGQSANPPAWFAARIRYCAPNDCAARTHSDTFSSSGANSEAGGSESSCQWQPEHMLTPVVAKGLPRVGRARESASGTFIPCQKREQERPKGVKCRHTGPPDAPVGPAG